MHNRTLSGVLAIAAVALIVQPKCHGQYFEPGYSGQSTEHFSGQMMPPTNDQSHFAGSSPQVTNPQPADASGVPYRNGFLGKLTLGGSYASLGIDDPDIASISDNLDGYQIHFNCPISKLTSETSGVDFFASYKSLGLSGQDPNGNLNLDMGFDFLTVGMRYYHEVAGRFRPYASLGARQHQFDMSITDFTGAPLLSGEFNDWVLYSAVGFEVDFFQRLGLRLDIELLPEEFADGFLEGKLIYWSAQKRFFFEGGFQAPFESDLSTGGILGLGVAF